ncbi:protein E9 [Elephant endotheliotropic herpesvirus 6]|nr:protein E9 [Elephant endotheliotropic herpesvirus 6]
MHVESEADIERIYQTNFFENCSYVKQNFPYKHDRYTLHANRGCVFKTAKNILQFDKVYYRYDFIHTDTYITSMLICIAIISLLLCVFYRETKLVYRSVSIFDPCLCVAITTWTIYQLFTRNFMIGLHGIRTMIKGSIEFNYFINVYSVMLCVIALSCVVVYVKTILHSWLGKNHRNIYFGLGL